MVGDNAAVREETTIGARAAVGYASVVKEGVVFGKRARTQSHCVVAKEVVLEDDVFLGPGVVVLGGRLMSTAGAQAGADFPPRLPGRRRSNHHAGRRDRDGGRGRGRVGRDRRYLGRHGRSRCPRPATAGNRSARVIGVAREHDPVCSWVPITFGRIGSTVLFR